jgi:biopolymer transport protein ExbD
MAEMETKDSGHKKGPGVKKGKKMSTRVDLTPMVDLGFLLITFFMFTTTMSQPKAMQLNTPDKSDPADQTKVKESCTMTMLLGSNNKIFAHIGVLKPDASNVVQYNFGNVREGLIKFKEGIPLTDTAFMNIIIKPSDSCTFANTIDAIDEMTINGFSRYAKVDMPKDEFAMTEKLASMAPPEGDVKK